MKNIVFINGSPKIKEKSASEFFLAMAEEKFPSDIQKSFINIGKSMTSQQNYRDLQIFSQADGVIFAFPLYVFSLPGALIAFLEEYYKLYTTGKIKQNKTPKIYAIINCGFPEAEINLEASRVIKSFARHVKANFRFSILIGGGAMLPHSKDAPFMKKTLKELEGATKIIAEDFEKNNTITLDNISIAMKVPRKLYFFMGNLNWIFAARRNNLKRKDLYEKPYRNQE